MEVLLISRGIPSTKDPMWGNFEYDQAQAIASFGHKVTTMSIDRRIRFYWRKIGITHINIGGIDMYNYYFPLPYRLLPRCINNFFVNFFSKSLYKHILKEKEGFDVIHGHYLPNIRIATVLKKEFGVPTVGTEHWSELKRKNIRVSVRKDALETYPKLDFLISVSYPLRDIILREFNINSSFVGCVIDSVFSYIPIDDKKIFKFIAVGSLFKIKGFDFLIDSFALAEFTTNVQVHIIGDGPMKGDLEQLIEQKGLSKQVFLEGRKTREEIMDFMAQSSVYLLTSISENFATACMEALSAGVPAIMTKCGGPEDFVDESNAVLVEVGDKQAMAHAMHFMYENIEKYDSQTISDNIKKKYSGRAIAEQLDAIYREVKIKK